MVRQYVSGSPSRKPSRSIRLSGSRQGQESNLKKSAVLYSPQFKLWLTRFQSAFGAKVATRDTSQKIKIVPDVAICGSVTVRERFRQKKKVWQHATAPPKKKTGLALFLFLCSHF